MKKINKRINLKNGNICYSNNMAYAGDIKRVSYSVVDEDKNLIKRMDFSIWDDMSFTAWPKGEIEDILKLKQIDFTIDKNNPLFNPLNKFLENEDSFILDDDETSGKDRKIMQICRKEEAINVLFENKLDIEDRTDLFDNFRIFVKNIGYDGRSKLDIEYDYKVAQYFKSHPEIQIEDMSKLYKEKAFDKFDTKKRLGELFESIEAEIIPKEKLENILMPDIMGISADYLDEKKEVLFQIIPELKDEDGFNQKNPWHIYDVWHHTLVALEKSRHDFEIRLALLLHDIGKPHSYQDDGDVRHFKGHSDKSAEISKRILERLGYEKEQIDNIVYLIKNHSTTIDIEKVNKDNIELTKKLLNVQYCDAGAYNPEYTGKVLEKLNKIGNQLIEKEEYFKDDGQR